MRALFFFLCLAIVPACSNDTFGSVDSGAGDAAGGDAVTGDASCPSFCGSMTAPFCSDFDEGTFGADWNPVAAPSPQITISPSTDVVESCPTAMHVAIAQDLSYAGEASFSFFQKALSPPGTMVTVTLDAHLPDIALPDAGTQLPLDGFGFFALSAASDASYYAALERSADGAWFVRMHQGSSSTGNPPSALLPGFPVGKWAHLVLSVVLSNQATGGSVSITYDPGAGPVTKTTGPTQTMPSGNNDVMLDLGATRLSATSRAYDAYFDNVVATFTK
ncbi:MAG TPA: hypothetical protein VGH28_30645 [Polyangiaceae bacterium]|jgi:hypothetical protein